VGTRENALALSLPFRTHHSQKEWIPDEPREQARAFLAALYEGRDLLFIGGTTDRGVSGRDEGDG
jgi:hypothetical protein